MSMSDAKQRIHWVDVTKGVLIVLLIFFHFPPAITRLEYDISPFWFVNCWQAIYSCFFMQAFFFLSGYCSSFPSDGKVFFYKLFKQLFLPFVCFEILYCVWSALTKYGMSLEVLYGIWRNSNGTSFWFLNALMFSKVIIWLVLQISPSRVMLFAVSLLLLVAGIIFECYDIGSNFLFLRPSMLAVFFVTLGYILKDNNRIFNRLIVWGSAGFPYLLLFLVFFKLPIPEVTAAIKVDLLSMPLFLLLSISGTFACIYYCMRIKEFRLLEYFGRNTLIVYCIHFIVLVSLADLLYRIIIPVGLFRSIVYVVVLFIFVFVVFSAIIQLFKIKPFKWLLGHF